ncbi:MAG TPA: diacylglycerol kinase family protein [Spirochaetota bacterium]|nr:diacylglycerol kinase family protein [Spirochaetota bacterium]
MGKIPIIVSPYSRKNKKTKGNSIETFKKIGGDRVDVHPAATIEELDAVAEDCKKRIIPFVAISGGDGTLHQVISRFINIYAPAPIPPVIILKDGTMNNISGTIKLKGDGYAILKRLLRAMERRRPVAAVTRYTMRIDDRYCFLFGTGLTTNVLNAVYEGDRKDFPKVARVIIKAFSDGIIRPDSSPLYRRLKAKVFFNGEELASDDLLGILAGTVEDVGMGFRPLNREMPKEPGFHVIATGVKPTVLAWHILTLARGGTFNHPLHYDNHVKNLRIVSDGPFEYTMDGDMYFAEREIYVETGPTVALVSV